MALAVKHRRAWSEPSEQPPQKRLKVCIGHPSKKLLTLCLQIDAASPTLDEVHEDGTTFTYDMTPSGSFRYVNPVSKWQGCEQPHKQGC